MTIDAFEIDERHALRDKLRDDTSAPDGKVIHAAKIYAHRPAEETSPLIMRLRRRSFGKAHFNVLRDIRAILDDCDEDAKLNFEFCPEPSAKQRGKRLPFYK